MRSIQRAILNARLGVLFMGVMLLASIYLGSPTIAHGAPAVATAPTAAKSDASSGFGAHGMAVFGGEEGLYASHLPMFHRPHDVQLVFRFHLADATADAALRSNLTAKPALWTLDPTKFDLYRFAPKHSQPLTQFAARFVEGHFERGGKERFDNQVVVVDEVILYQTLDFTLRAESPGRYLKIGKGAEQFLIKRIDRRPDFDIIAALKSTNGVAQVKQRTSNTASTKNEILLPTKHLDAPLVTQLQAAIGDASITVSGILYFETKDLK